MQPCLDGFVCARACRSLRRRDPRLGRVIREVGPCRLEPSGDAYGGLVRAVLHQQLAGAAARAIEGRLKAAHGDRYPTPAELLAADEVRLRGLGLSRQKAAALRAVAQAFESGQLSASRISSSDDAGVVADLTAIKGVGVWTAHMVLIFGLGRPDVLPVGDYGVRKGAQRLYELEAVPSPCELEELAEAWRPWRSVAAWYLWRAAEGAGVARPTLRPGSGGVAKQGA
jgi:DNA-3-methyladenine glycosylase II